MRPKVEDQDVPGGKRDLIGYGTEQPQVVWPNGARLAINLVVNNEEGSENSIPSGDGKSEGLAELMYAATPEDYRDLWSESIYEYGSRAGVVRLLRMFDEYKVKSTFYTTAVALERNPGVADWVRESGHEPCSHGWRFEEHFRLSRDEEREHIAWAVESIKETTGERPLGWYCRYGPSVSTRELLVEEGGFLYDSLVGNDDLPNFTEVNGKQWLVVPYSITYNDGRFVVPQGFGAPVDFVDVCKRGIDELWLEGERGFPKMISIGLHPRWIGQAGRASALREVLEYAQEKGDVWFARRDEIARWWIDHHEEWDRVDVRKGLAS